VQVVFAGVTNLPFFALQRSSELVRKDLQVPDRFVELSETLQGRKAYFRLVDLSSSFPGNGKKKWFAEKFLHNFCVTNK